MGGWMLLGFAGGVARVSVLESVGAIWSQNMSDSDAGQIVTLVCAALQ